MSTRTQIGLIRGAAIGFMATVVSDSWAEAFVMLLCLVVAFVLTDALAESE